MRKKPKKYKKPENWTFEMQLEYLGFDPIPCEKCSSKHFIGYHRKGIENIECKVCPVENRRM